MSPLFSATMLCLIFIWILLTENTVRSTYGKKRDRNLSVLKDMLSFVHCHYAGKVSLEDIAKSGNVSKSTCLAIFKKYLHNTPASYLIGYRLNKSQELLLHTDFTISEIASEAGFDGCRYFSETFRKYYGVAPVEYKKRYAKASESSPY